MTRLLALSMIFGCTRSDDVVEQVGLDVLGNGTGLLAEVTLDVIGDDDDGLDVPRDLAFNPEVPGELWVVNRDDDSVSIFFDAGTDDQDSDHIVDPYALHFMEEVSSIAFGAPGTFGTCQESRNTYNGMARPNDFMGPTLWSSDLEIFGESNPEAVRYLTDLFGMRTDLGSHLDMLHETPDCMGIAWDHDNVYWAFGGLNESIDRVDFRVDHGPGFDDHSDGEILRYLEGEISRVEDVHSGMVVDHAKGLLYVVDSGNNRVLALDTASGERGRRIRGVEPGTEVYEMDNAEFSVLIDGAEHGLEVPSGLAMVGDLLFLTDNATSIVYGFTTQGELVDWVDLERDAGALMGLTAAGPDELWLVDAEADKVLRLRP